MSTLRTTRWDTRVYRDPKYLALLNLTHLQRGTQLVGESSALGKAPEPVSLFTLVPAIPPDTSDIYPKESVNLAGNGFAILRNENPRTYLYLDYGILGGEHGHPDRLQMGYYADGRNWIVDPLNEVVFKSQPSALVPPVDRAQHARRGSDHADVDERLREFLRGAAGVPGGIGRLHDRIRGRQTHAHAAARSRRWGSYFIDLFDAAAPEAHIYDLPLHSFGGVKVNGVPA